MMRWRCGLTALLLILTIAFTFAFASGVHAESHEAALIVDYGDGTITYAIVPFAEESVSGYELLRASGLSLVSIRFGGLGEGVCSIEEHGCSVAECRRLCQTSNPSSPFWQYFSKPDGGDWQAHARGASGVIVEHGDIEGWSWTGTEPSLPDLSFAEISTLAGASKSGDSPRSTTYDAQGNVIRASDDGPEWVAYGGAAALTLGLVAMLFLGRRARARALADRKR